MEQQKISFFNKINTRVLVILVSFFTIAAVVVSLVDSNNIRKTYEQNFTERVLLTNALMARSISSADVEVFVDLMTGMDDEFKARQVQFYYDRLAYWELDEDEELPEATAKRMRDFRAEMDALKDGTNYWDIIAQLQELNELSRSEYLYVMADTGLMTDEGEVLYTFIFANDDEPGAGYDADGLGTSDTSIDTILTVYETKKQMDWVDYYNDVYGELYYAYAPILNDEGEVIAVFGTDLNLGNMNALIMQATLTSNLIFLAVYVAVMLVIFFFLHRSIITPIKGLTDTAHELAKGNIYAPISQFALSQKTEIGVLASAINEMSLVYQDMVKDAGSLFADAKIGKLDSRKDTKKFKGDIKDFITQTNLTLDATTKYLNCIPESVLIMSRELEIHFRNEDFLACFGDISGAEFAAQMLQCSVDKGGYDLEELKSKLMCALDKRNFSSGAWINERCYSVLFREIEVTGAVDNSILAIAVDITELMTEKERAQAAAKSKAEFLSRMSHEMRTPMNAIIGMAKIAEKSEDTSKLKYCLENIDVSATHLLGIINDVLDMSKIEAGKLELECLPINIEKILMKVCNIIVDNMESKAQRFNVVLHKGLDLNYMGDGLRLSQVITNLLSNAVKFTPEGGKITLDVEKTEGGEEYNTLRFSVTDTGIGMTAEQVSRLFNTFEQADGSVSRKYGGSGLGLSISKSIVEQMGGKIWVESSPGVGSTFIFDVRLKRASHQNAVIFDGIRPENLRLLIIENDEDILSRFMDITRSFGIAADSARSASDAQELISKAHSGRQYDIIFLAYELEDANALELVKKLRQMVDKNTVIIITTFMEWQRIEKDALKSNIYRYITKPLFPSSILDAINSTIGTTLKKLDIKKPEVSRAVDLTGVRILLAEDVAINREIFIALLAHTNIAVDCAENGLIAVEKFKSDPNGYDLIVMDIQMPEMDGITATQTIRAIDSKRAKEVPIIAMTANAFKEDIDRCLAAGMNDHLAKPIDEKLVIQKIAEYTTKRG